MLRAVQASHAFTFGPKCILYELRTKFRLGGTKRGTLRVLGRTYSGIYYKFSPGLI